MQQKLLLLVQIFFDLPFGSPIKNINWWDLLQSHLVLGY